MDMEAIFRRNTTFYMKRALFWLVVVTGVNFILVTVNLYAMASMKKEIIYRPMDTTIQNGSFASININQQSISNEKLSNNRPLENRGCNANLQAVLFCYILGDLGLTFQEDEIQVDHVAHKITFRNREFPILLPIDVVRTCLVDLAVTTQTIRHLVLSWCTPLSVVKETGTQAALPDVKIFDFFNRFMMTRAVLTPELTNEYPTEITSQFGPIREKNIHYLLETHILDTFDVFFLKNSSVNSYGNAVLGSSTCIHVYAWGSNTWPMGNWGDLLGPYITGKLTGKIPCILNEQSAAVPTQLLGTTGSIASKPQISLFWSSGIISEDSLPRPEATYIAVRGPVTQLQCLKYLHNYKFVPVVSGDSALLMPLLYNPSDTTKAIDLCIVLHGADAADPIITSRMPAFATVINIGNVDLERFVDVVVTCRYLASTSLHGLIAAHSYGVPGVALALSNKLVGGSYKFRDYYNSLEIYMDQYRTQIEPSLLPQDISFYQNLIQNKPQPSMETLKKLQIKLLQTFPFPVGEKFQRIMQ